MLLTPPSLLFLPYDSTEVAVAYLRYIDLQTLGGFQHVSAQAQVGGAFCRAARFDARLWCGCVSDWHFGSHAYKIMCIVYTHETNLPSDSVKHVSLGQRLASRIFGGQLGGGLQRPVHA